MITTKKRRNPFSSQGYSDLWIVRLNLTIRKTVVIPSLLRAILTLKVFVAIWICVAAVVIPSLLRAILTRIQV